MLVKGKYMPIHVPLWEGDSERCCSDCLVKNFKMVIFIKMFISS